jgi:hypothetical protein
LPAARARVISLTYGEPRFGWFFFVEDDGGRTVLGEEVVFVGTERCFVSSCYYYG